MAALVNYTCKSFIKLTPGFSVSRPVLITYLIALSLEKEIVVFFWKKGVEKVLICWFQTFVRTLFKDQRKLLASDLYLEFWTFWRYFFDLSEDGQLKVVVGLFDIIFLTDLILVYALNRSMVWIF